MANPALEHFQANRLGSVGTDRVTLDSVVQKTAITLGILFLTATAAWTYFTSLLGSDPNSVDAAGLSMLYAVTFVASITTLALSFVISFKTKPSPPLVMLYAGLEGLVLGVFSKSMAMNFGEDLVVSAVMGTFITAASTLAVYKFFNIQASDRMRKYVTIGMFAFVGVSLFSLVASFFGAGLGVNGFGPMGFLFSLIGLGLALFMLVIDFTAIEESVEYGAPAEEAWRLAFGLTVTLVWIYVNLIRLLAILRGSD